KTMTKARTVISGLAILLYLCVFSVTVAGQSGPVIESITPDTVPAGSLDTFVTVKGSGFNPSSAIYNEGFATSLPTTFIDTATLRAVIPYRSLASPGRIVFWVRTTDTSGSHAPFVITVYSTALP